LERLPTKLDIELNLNGNKLQNPKIIARYLEEIGNLKSDQISQQANGQILNLDELREALR
jgi:hypothetical protein